MSIPQVCDPAITLLSPLIAIASSAFALRLVCQKTLPWSRLGVGALLMRPAIPSTHYTDMVAMRMTPGIEYDLLLFVPSVVIAITASDAAPWTVFHLRLESWTAVRQHIYDACQHYDRQRIQQRKNGSTA
ncbi:MHYT domain-containing protein [Paraburkholderia sp. Cy-641]|uniref:MHYT domain-containing protein n=1 Tax=Burkholderiaceae TaxID=119060 RepID=UPI0031F55DB9